MLQITQRGRGSSDSANAGRPTSDSGKTATPQSDAPKNEPYGRDWLTHTLRELRENAGLSGTAAARQAGISQSRISRIETLYLPTEAEVTTLADLCKAPATIRWRLLKAVKDLRAEEAPARVVLQRGASRLQQFESSRPADGAGI